MPEKKNPDSLIEIIRHRRSVRKYDAEPVAPETLDAAAAAAKLAPACSHDPSWNIQVLLDKGVKGRLQKAVLSGLRGRLQTWLGAKEIPGMICVTGRPDKAPRKADKLFYLLETAMAFEYFVLAAREADLGTCWVGAFDEPPIANALEIAPNRRIVAVSPIGKLYKRTLSPLDINGQYDRLARNRMHENRFPIGDIAFSERFERSAEWDLTPDPAALEDCRSAGMEQGGIVAGLAAALDLRTAFAKKNVEEAKLNWLLEAARLAPSASNTQIWRFVVVREKENLRELGTCAHNENGFQAPFGDAAAAIVVLSEERISRERAREQPFFLIDVPIAMSHILLMTAELGLAANVVLQFHENKVRHAVHAPLGTRAVAIISLGYPPARGARGDFPEDMVIPKNVRKKAVDIIS